MSRKINTFTQVIPQPLTARDITMVCSRLPQSMLVVQSATFPFEDMQSVNVLHRGAEVSFPTYTKVQGDWSFTVADSRATSVLYELRRLQARRDLFDVILIPAKVTDADLIGSIVSVAKGQLITSGAVTNKALTVGMIGGAVLLSSVKLCKAWVKSIKAVTFDNAAPDKAITWSVDVHYNWIEPLNRLG